MSRMINIEYDLKKSPFFLLFLYLEKLFAKLHPILAIKNTCLVLDKMVPGVKMSFGFQQCREG